MFISDESVENYKEQEKICRIKVRDVLCSKPYWVTERPTKIFNHLLIGSCEDARDLDLLKSLNVTHVLNCAAGTTGTSKRYYGNSVVYEEFWGEDDFDYDITQHFYDAIEFIERARKNNGVVLVHCIMGINRSGAVCVAYAMKHRSVGVVEATRLVKQRRGALLSNHSFQEQLVKYARRNKMLDPALEVELL